MLASFIWCRSRSVRKPWKSTFSITPLSFESRLQKYPQKYCQKLESSGNIFVADRSILIPIFVVASERLMCFEIECIMALQGHPRSLILAPIESACATSYWSSIVTLVISCPVSEILRLFCWEERPHPYSTRILGVFPLDKIADVVALKSEDRTLITDVITFELV